MRAHPAASKLMQMARVEGLQATLDALRRDQRATLRGIRVPTTVIAGTGDRIITPERSEEMASAIPGALLERLEGVGHMVPAEAPDGVTQALRAASDAARSA